MLSNFHAHGEHIGNQTIGRFRFHVVNLVQVPECRQAAFMPRCATGIRDALLVAFGT
jgi:hypothetical protein